MALSGNRHGTDVRSIRIPGRLKVELTYPEKKETRVLHGDSGWVIFDDRPAETANAPQRDAMKLQLMRLYSPLALRDRIDALSLTAEGDWLALSLTEDGLRTDYLVNKEKWRIEKVVGTLRINGNEMRFLTGRGDEVSGAAALRELGAEIVVVTDGSRGARFFCGDGEGSVQGFPVEVADTTGAGDGFAAGLLSELARSEWPPDSETISEAVRFANAVAARVCTAVGAVSSLPDRKQVIQMLSE